MSDQQLSLFEIVPNQPKIKVTHDPYWDEITRNADTQQAEIQGKSVSEQVVSDTLTTECIGKSSCSLTHWIEVFYVPRQQKKHYYYRYTWMNGRKLHRKYIGSVNSQRAIALKNQIQEMINQGRSPSEIIQVLSGYSDRPL